MCGLAEELRYPALTAVLAPGERGTDELAKFGDAHHDRRIDLGGSIENGIGALEIAGKNQKLGEQDPAAEIGRVPAHGTIRRLDRCCELAGSEQLAGGVLSFWHR